MKKTLITIVTAIAALLAFCILYFVWYFHSIGGVTTGEKITQGLPDKPALLVIDIQDGITGRSATRFTESMVRQSEPLINKVNRSISFAQNNAVPVIYIRQENAALPLRLISRNFLAPGTPGAELDKRVTVVPGPVFTKGMMDAFSNPAFEEYLKGAGINHLYITGLSASACVDRTVRAALNRGYIVTAVTDAIIAEKPKDKERKCKEWADAHAVLVEADRL